MNRSPAFYIWWKEFRAVLPLWGIALLALVLPTIAGSVWSTYFGPDDWRMITYPVGVIAFISAIFTREFQDKTMLSQLLLPQHRFTPLVRKLCVALSLQLVMFAVYLFVLTPQEWGNPSVVWTFVLGVNAVTLAGGCFWGLVTKQGAATVAVSIAFPWIAGIIGLGFVQWFALDLGPNSGYWIMMGGFAIYSIACAVGALVYWSRFQAKGDSVVASGLDTAVLSRLPGKRKFFKRAAWVALIWKELGIQRFCFWLAAIMIVSAIAFTTADFLIGMSIQSAGMTGRGEKLVDLQNLLRAFGSALFVIFVAMMPVLAGSQAFAEEAHLGNRAWQLTQPVSARRQWAIKLGTAACLSMALGLMLPLLIAWGYAMLRMGDPFLPGFEPGSIPAFLLIHALVFCVTAWCATWSSTTISAIMKAVLALLVFFVLQGWLSSVFASQTATIYYFDRPDWRWAALAVVLVASLLTLLNHSRLALGLRRIVGQIAALALFTILVLLIDSRL